MAETELDSVQHIIQFKEALARPEDASDSDEEYIGGDNTNLGNKLKRGARYVSRSALKVPSPTIDVQLVEYGGLKRAVIRKRRRVLYSEDVEAETRSMKSLKSGKSGIIDDSGDIDDDDDDDEIMNLPVDAILRPIADPAELPGHPSLSRTFNSNLLRGLSRVMLDSIVAEESNALPIANILASFLGDDQSLLKSENFAESDDIFEVPELTFDKDHGLPTEQAEELRQLFQLASQRIDEYKRCLIEVRGYLNRADRLRRKVLNWCKEVNGEDWVGEETGPDEYRLQQQQKQLQAQQRLQASSLDGDDMNSAVSASEA